MQVGAHSVRSILLPVFQDTRSKWDFPWRSKIDQGLVRCFAFCLALVNGRETSEKICPISLCNSWAIFTSTVNTVVPNGLGRSRISSHSYESRWRSLDHGEGLAYSWKDLHKVGFCQSRYPIWTFTCTGCTKCSYTLVTNPLPGGKNVKRVTSILVVQQIPNWHPYYQSIGSVIGEQHRHQEACGSQACFGLVWLGWRFGLACLVVTIIV